ncbi:hypothetical protein [Nocardiopsis valliformis]|uniref:hypothetical protein n=1 Tax=Nocardiopsis valliformis TaxID=239974 RepID=UPI000348ACA3|nr:hypothetical protein [Nocardiopsis valliformis]
MTGCFGFPGITDTTADGEAPLSVTEEALSENDTEEAPGENDVDLAEGQLDTSVFYAGLEYAFESVTVNDLDAETSPGDPPESRVLGVELVFEVNVFNPWAETLTPNTPITLRWDEPGTDNVAEVNGHGDFRQVPGDASVSGEVTVPLLPADLEAYHEDSARLVLGRGGEATAQVPVGSSPETVTRFPVAQPQLEGESFDVGPVKVTIDHAAVQWNYGDPSMGQAAEDEAVLVMDFTVDNGHGGQVCTSRGQGNTMSLVSDGGEGHVDLGLDERCFGSGDSVATFTGFTIAADYADSYLLSMTVPAGFDTHEGELPLSLVEGEGTAPSTDGGTGPG